MRRTAAGSLGLIAGLLAGAAGGHELSPAEIGRLKHGEVLVEVTTGADRLTHVWAAEEIAAPPETVWRVMTDCEEALHYVPRLKACKVVDADREGRWDVRRHELSTLPLLPSVRATFRLDYDRPHAMRFRQVAGDMTGSQGEWRLEALDGGRGTRVIYSASLRFPAIAPDALARSVMRDDAPAALEGLRRLSLGRLRR